MNTRPITPEDLDLLGYHPFHAEPFEDDAPEPFGSFEVFWHDAVDTEPGDVWHDEYGDVWAESGFYWWPCFPGCLPDGEPLGPFESARAAIADADEWNPIFDG